MAKFGSFAYVSELAIALCNSIVLIKDAGEMGRLHANAATSGLVLRFFRLYCKASGVERTPTTQSADGASTRQTVNQLLGI